MKTTRFSLLVCFALCASFLNSADANHRTGSLALPEDMVAGDFNGDGNLDLAVNVTGFDNIAIFMGDGAGGLNLIGHLATNTLPKGLATADFDGNGIGETVVGVPFQNADIMDPHGDIVTHLQIGQIEIH